MNATSKLLAIGGKQSSLAIAMHGAPRLPWNAMDYMGI